MADTEVAYLERRAAAEADLAQRAKCPAAVNAHHQMSRAYIESAEALKQMARARTTGTSKRESTGQPSLA